MKLRGRISTLVLVAAGGPVVHELRCYLGFGSNGDAAAHGHVCLGSPAVAVTLLCGLALGQLVLQIASAKSRGSSGGRVPRTFAVWAASFLALTSLIAVQELAEGLFASAHGLSPLATFGHGGWLAVPLCAGLALLIAVWTRAAAHLVARLVGHRSARRPCLPSVAQPRPTHARRLGRPLALSRAGRAPPLAVSS